MKRYRIIVSIAAVIFAGVACQNIDVDGINRNFDNLDQRLNELEGKYSDLDKMCKEFNSNISTMNSIASVLEGKELITSISEIVENGEVVGYEITFSKSGVKRIYNGKNGRDGENGVTPEFKIVDGYWQVRYGDGEWMIYGKATGDNGAPGTPGDPGTPGTPGLTPEFQIVDGYWQVRYGDGEWIECGKATGDSGAPGAPGEPGLTPEFKIEEGDWYVRFGDGQWMRMGQATGDPGTPGKDAPKIGIMIGEDNAYYWTLDGELLLDQFNNPVVAGGQNGLTPQLKIEDGYWWVRYGEGEWTKYERATGNDGADGTVWTIGDNGNWFCNGEDSGKPSQGADGTVWTIGDNGNWFCNGEDTGNPSQGATGPQGPQGPPGSSGSGGDSFFTSVESDGSSLTLGLAAGGTIVVPIAGDLSISFATSTNLSATPGATLSISYTITSSTGAADIDVMPTSGLKAKVEENGLNGVITVVVGPSVDFEYDKVTVIVTNGNKTLLKKITFTEGGSIVVTDEHTTSLMTCKGGNVNFNIAANVEYQVSITSGGSPANWVHHISTRALTPYNLGFSVDPNTGGRRTATITISSSETSDTAEFTVIQYAATGSFVVTGTGGESKPVEIAGSNLDGLVVFEGEIEEWTQGASHTYSDAAAHSAEYFVENATGFSLQNLTDLVNLNVADF